MYVHVVYADLAGDPLPRGEIRLRLLRVLKTCGSFSAKPTAVGRSVVRSCPIAYMHAPVRLVCASSLLRSPPSCLAYEAPRRDAVAERDRSETVRSAHGILDASSPRYFHAVRPAGISRALHSVVSRNAAFAAFS